MPKDTTITKILVIGSGPIVIGQGCEFDYSGVQACKALREEGYQVVLINSNPATIMTDPEFAARTYIEPITPDIVERIIKKEKPDALLPTLGGQTALNCSMKLHELGVLARHNVRMIGAKPEAIHKGEDRQAFKEAMIKIGLDMPMSGIAKAPRVTVKDPETGRETDGFDYQKGLDIARSIAAEIGTFPLIIRPGFTLGGSGGGIAYNREEFDTIVARGLEMSPVAEVLIDESLLGWKEFEMEVMRDRADNCVVICSIENFDPMGVHTGDSITVAPIQTLTDREYQVMRDASFAVIREIGVETGGSNIQFATHPKTGRMIVIEMNPRVSRSSALASKATGFPIAKIAAKLAVGYTLDEIRNDITRETPASFEPTIDYVVTKVPRFTFEKFPDADPTLTTQMKSVGEAMAIGRTFKESLQKALRSLETGRFGLGGDGKDPTDVARTTIERKLSVPNADRLFWTAVAMRYGREPSPAGGTPAARAGEDARIPFELEEIHELTQIDPWFLAQIERIVEEEASIRDRNQIVSTTTEELKTRDDFRIINTVSHEIAFDRDWLLKAKRFGFSDKQLGYLLGVDQSAVRQVRLGLGLTPTYRLVDTCAAEFEAYTPYYYSTYGDENEARAGSKPRIMILGGGPNRIGQGIEFDYCCVHASFALKELGYETIMVNSNPETVSTDYDTSDKLYFEPLTLEDVLNIYEQEKPEGVIVQFGGQTPLNLAASLEAAGVPIIGTSPAHIALAEDRKYFAKLLDDLKLNQAPSGTALNEAEALAIAQRIGFPVLVRPSFVLGGRGMRIVYDEQELLHYVRQAMEIAGLEPGSTSVPADRPILIDRFLDDATEVDVDIISDGETTVIGAIMEHIEQAGVHSGDSACVIPSISLTTAVLAEIRRAAQELAKALHVIGLMNIQFAVKDGTLYVIEVNPRASRTAPFVSKAIGVPLPKLAAKVMAGALRRSQGAAEAEIPTLKKLGFTEEIIPSHYSVKEAVFPFVKFPGIDIVLGPEMKSTGEVMGIDPDFGLAFAKSQMATGGTLPTKGNLFISVQDRHKSQIGAIAREYHALGFTLFATDGTAREIEKAGSPVTLLFKLADGRRPNVLDKIKNGEIQFIINTPSESESRTDEVKIRSAAVTHKIPIMTTLSGARTAIDAIRSLQTKPIEVRPLQEYHPKN
ncbi:MAG: carbamoyl-phosphate synthase large subunit [Verrucomicrobiales bacterium]